jgi:hypothetical protein
MDKPDLPDLAFHNTSKWKIGGSQVTGNTEISWELDRLLLTVVRKNNLGTPNMSLRRRRMAAYIAEHTVD